MALTSVLTAAPRHEGSSELYEFRSQALRVVLWTLPLVALGILGVLTLGDSHQVPLSLSLLVLVLLLLTGVGLRLLDHDVTLAALVSVAGLLIALTGAIHIVRHSLLATLYCLIVLVASATLGTRAIFGTAGVTTTVVLVHWAGPSAAIDAEVAVAAIALIAASALLCWMATNPVYVALEWAWQSYERSREMTEELRDRQGELGRVVKSLNEAYVQLEELNFELTRARLAAEEARRLKAEFAANISHELRTPLNLIIGFAEMMATSPQAYRGAILPAPYRGDLDAILRNAQHLSSLIDDVLDLSQIEAGRMGLLKEKVSLARVVGEATEAVARLIDSKGLSLKCRLATDLPEVYVDCTRLRQVLINLLTNAVRFTDSGGITIAARMNGSDVLVSVADTGIGIAPDDIPKVFEEFRQLDGSIRRRAGGSGLGLAISKQFVELHGGSMWAESRIGDGTTFHFTLPLGGNVLRTSLHRDRDNWDRAVAERGPATPEVRVVASDPSIPRIFQRYLDGYRVTGYPAVADLPSAAGPGRSAREACVVVCSSSEEAWRELRTWQPNAGGAVIAACALPGKRDLARELGASAYLMKPVSRDQVLEAFSEVGVEPRSVLIADDDPDMRRLLSHWVRTTWKGCRVRLASDGVEALAHLRSRPPSVMLLDLLMGEVGGYAVLQEMRADEKLRDVPVIVVTARGRESDTTSGLIGITRHEGLAVRDLLRCLQASLDALLKDPGSGDREPQATSVESPA